MNHRVTPRVDKLFVTYLSLLTIAGLFILFSASQPAAVQMFDDGNHFIRRQMLFGIIPGLALLILAARSRIENLKKFSWILYAIAIVLLALVYIPGIGVTINNSRSWISFFGFTFQPSEFAKLAVAFIAALLLSSERFDKNDWRTGLMPVLGVLAPIILLILAEPDLGTLIIIIGEIFGMFIIAKIPFQQLAILALLGIIGVAAMVAIAPYRAKRISVFLNPESDQQGYGYQMNQAYIAAGSGGVLGLGFWNSRQKYQYLPEASADTIFAIVAEELGLVGSASVILLVLFFVFRGLRISRRSEDGFGSLLAAGIMVWFGWQSFLNIGAAVGALPLTGVPLPFVSHGGSALLMALGASGVVISISKTSRLN